MYVVCSLLNWYCFFQLLQSLHKKHLNNVCDTLKFIFDFVPFFCGRQFIKVIPNWAILQTALCARYYETKKVLVLFCFDNLTHYICCSWQIQFLKLEHRRRGKKIQSQKKTFEQNPDFFFSQWNVVFVNDEDL